MQHYGRTALELMVSQAIILTLFLVAPFDLIQWIGTFASGAVAMAMAAVVASVLFARHRGRMAGGDMQRKLKVLREAAA